MFYETLKWDVPVNKKTSLERFFDFGKSKRYIFIYIFN